MALREKGPARTLVAAAEAAGCRLDHFVASTESISVSAARKLIESGLIEVDGRRAAKGVRLAVGQRIAIQAINQVAAVLPDPSLKLTVIYQDAHLVAIDKPGGQPSHPLRRGEGGTAANAIVARFPDCAEASVDPREGGLGHRLDTGTSGVLIAARSREAWLGLRQALGSGDCEKRYLCEVWGSPSEVGTVDLAIGRIGRRGRTVRVGGGGRQPQPATSEWRVLARRGDTSLLEVRLHAGRAHQVRAHLAAVGFPLVGDVRYGDPPLPKAEADDRPEAADASLFALHLHAAAVRLRHPMTGALLEIVAPPPRWARDEKRTASGAVS